MIDVLKRLQIPPWKFSTVQRKCVIHFVQGLSTNIQEYSHINHPTVRINYPAGIGWIEPFRVIFSSSDWPNMTVVVNIIEHSHGLVETITPFWRKVENPSQNGLWSRPNPNCYGSWALVKTNEKNSAHSLRFDQIDFTKEGRSR